MATYELPFFRYGITPTWWKLPLITFTSWSLALIFTFCAACQSAYPLLYLLPLVMMLAFLGAFAFSVYKLVTNWQALYGVDISEMRTYDVVSLVFPLLYAASWGVAFIITLRTFINVEWPILFAVSISQYFLA